MAEEVKVHVRTCPICQRIKVRLHKPYGKFMPVKPSDRLWASTSMDWITDLPLTAETENNDILVILELLSKRVILIACKSTMTAEQCAEVYFERVVSQHGLQRRIHSDRDSRFTSKFWTTLWSKLGTKLKLTSSFNPRGNAQNERVHIPIEDMLRAISQYPPLHWDRDLSYVEYAINNSINLDTGYTPFQISEGQHPLDPFTVHIGADQTDKVRNMKEVTEKAYKTYTEAQQRRLDKANTRRIDPQFKVNEDVLLKSEFLTWPGSELMGKKFNDRYMGPFKILRMTKSGNAAELDFSDVESRIHPVIPVSRLEKYYADNRFMRQHNKPTPAILHEGREFFNVESLANRRKRGSKYHYLVKYEGYGAEYNQWIPEIWIVDSCKDLIEKYDQKYPR